MKKNPRTYKWEPSDEADDHWNAPLSGPEAGFWRGVSVGAAIEAAVIILVFMLWYWLL